MDSATTVHRHGGLAPAWPTSRVRGSAPSCRPNRLLRELAHSCPDESIRAFEAASPCRRLAYLDAKVAAKPATAPALATLMRAQLTRRVWATNVDPPCGSCAKVYDAQTTGNSHSDMCGLRRWRAAAVPTGCTRSPAPPAPRRALIALNRGACRARCARGWAVRGGVRRLCTRGLAAAGCDLVSVYRRRYARGELRAGRSPPGSGEQFALHEAVGLLTRCAAARRPWILSRCAADAQPVVITPGGRCPVIVASLSEASTLLASRPSPLIEDLDRGSNKCLNPSVLCLTSVSQPANCVISPCCAHLLTSPMRSSVRNSFSAHIPRVAQTIRTRSRVFICQPCFSASSASSKMS